VRAAAPAPPGGAARWRRALAPSAAALVALLVGFSLCRRGIILSDEGFLLLQALDLTRGKVLYRDMDSFVAPGAWFLLAGLFRLVEPSVLASRLLALVCWCATLGTVVRIVRVLSGARAAWGAAAVFLAASVWAFPAWTWSFYSPWSVLFALVATERLLAWRRERRSRDLLLLGVALGLAVVFKQNYGVLAGAGCVIGVAAVCYESRASAGTSVRGVFAAPGPVALGMALVAAPVLAYFARHAALGDAFQALVIHPFGGFLGTHDIAYLAPSEIFTRERMAGVGRLTYGAYALSNTALRFDWPVPLVRAVEILHVLLYWIPPALFATAAWIALVPVVRGLPSDGGLLALLAVAGFLFLGVFPRADFNHLVNVYQPVVALGAVVVERVFARGPGSARLPNRTGLAAGGALLAAYAVVAAYWYVDLLRSLDSEIPLPRGGVLVSEAEQQMLGFEVGAIRAGTREGEAVLTLPGFAMLNFLADRPMPGRYYNLYAVHIAHDRGAGVVEGAEAGGVRLAVADYHDFFSERNRLRDYAPLLTEYLRRNFAPAFSVAIDEHLFLRRRPTPLPQRPTLDVADCDAGRSGWDRRSLYPHLLFDILYHFLDDASGAATQDVSTLCRVSVPGPAELAFRVGYRQPTEVRPGSELSAEIWAHREGRSDELLYREALPLVPVRGWNSPPAAERRVDLSRFAGETPILVFRTRFRGEVRMNLLDFKGFAMVWQDPRIELADGPG
jgi:hypothetical protein